MTDNDEVTQITPIESIHTNVDKFIGAAGVEKVYGEPVTSGGTIILPAAEVITSMGFGMGGSAKGEGGGGGGGFSTSRPVAIVVVSEHGVRVEPVMDVTKVALAFFTAFGFMLSTLAKMRRGK